MYKSSQSAHNNCINYSFGNENVSAPQDIEKILCTYYQTLKYIQGTAVDLDFQTQ